MLQKEPDGGKRKEMTNDQLMTNVTNDPRTLAYLVIGHWSFTRSLVIVIFRSVIF